MKWKEKSFEYWLRFCSFPTRYIGKTIFFFRVLWQLNKAIQYLRQTASHWNRYAMTFPLQKRATTYLCSCKRLVLFYRHDLLCLIMILPYSHSLSVQSVARNGYGYIRTMQRWNSCGLWQKPLNCLGTIFTESFLYTLNKPRDWHEKIPQVNLDYYWPGELVKI